MAADVTGYIIDKKCSTNKAMFGNVECAKSCMGGGSPAVLATEDKVKDSAGLKVMVTGKMDGNTITVETITPAKS
jgi:hypothetical protein